MDRHDTTAAAPDALESNLLARRLRELAGEERDIQVDFLVHLEVFDRRRAFLEAGYDSLWTYCLQVLHLREGPAWRRIGAMRILRRFPALEAPLRDGRLCLSTVTILGPVLTPDNFEDLVGRAAYRTKAEVDQIVASIQPRIAPRDGVRKLTQRTGMVASENATIAPGQLSATGSLEAASLPIASPGQKEALGVEEPASPEPALERASGSFPNAPTQFELRSPAPRPAEVRAVSADTFSLRVTIDADLKKDLDTLTALLSHKTSNDLQEVLREAVRCAIGEHGKRKGLVKPRPRRPRVGLRRRASERDPGAQRRGASTGGTD